MGVVDCVSEMLIFMKSASKIEIIRKKIVYLLKKSRKSLEVIKKSTTFASRLRENAYSNRMNAEIAQLVEHNLAKVGVASSSLVFRSHYEQRFISSPGGGMVDALVSGASVERRAGSSPVLGTRCCAKYFGMEKWRNW